MVRWSFLMIISLPYFFFELKQFLMLLIKLENVSVGRLEFIMSVIAKP